MKILIINLIVAHTDAIMAEKAKALSLPGVDVDGHSYEIGSKLVCSYEEQTVSIEEMVYSKEYRRYL